VFAEGTGAVSRRSIGTVVFSGLLMATVLSLFVVPVVYRIVKGWELSWLERQQSRPRSAG
jgi:multidrug efflux pump subunit AcrB